MHKGEKYIMKEKYSATLANFNCTQRIKGQTIPMLYFFKHIIWPALNDNELFRETGKEMQYKNKFYISDVKLVKLNDSDKDPIAIVGKHIKRTILNIRPDFDAKKGFIGNASQSPSAPYSTFILLLNNHRVIYFPNDKGAPNVQSFSATIGHIVTSYVSKQRTQITNQLIKVNNSKNKGYLLNDLHFDNLKNFRETYLDVNFQFPDVNVVAIESKDLVDEAFSQISKIKSVTFKFYKPNNEPLNFNNLFESCYNIIEQTKSTSLNQVLRNPEEKDLIRDGISSSEGKLDFNVQAVDDNNEPLSIQPDSVSLKVHVHVDMEETIDIVASNIYNQVKDKSCIKEVSEENENLYNELIDSVSALIE